MSGHNKWSTIKHKKGAADAKRGKIFTKIIREITVAAKMGGGDPTGNPRLRLAMFNARSHNMPKDNVERAIKKGTGELEGVEYVDFLFEGYGPNGVALLVEGMTDNINRISAEVRNIFGKGGGAFGAQGSVAWIFEKKGLILISKEGVGEDQLMDIGLSNGADDILDREDHWEVQGAPETFESLRGALEQAKIALASAEISMVPKNTVALNEEDARKLLKLIETLEDNDDVQKVHGNFDIADEIMEKIA